MAPFLETNEPSFGSEPPPGATVFGLTFFWFRSSLLLDVAPCRMKLGGVLGCNKYTEWDSDRGTNIYSLVLVGVGPFPAQVGPGTVTNGYSSKYDA